MMTGDHAGHGLLLVERASDAKDDVLPDAEPAATGRVVDLDRGRHDGARMARLEDPRKLPHRRASQLSGEDAGEQVALLGVASLVDVEHEGPGRARLVVRIAQDENDAETGEIDAVRLSVRDRPGERTKADAVGRPATRASADSSAGADRLAVARLQIRARERPGRAHERDGTGVGGAQRATYGDMGSMDDIEPPPGAVSAGIASGAASSRTPSTSRSATVPKTAMCRQGTSFSTAIKPATTAIQTRLMTPSAKSDAISAQQQPMHHAACLVPIRSPPTLPSRQLPSRKPSEIGRAS